MSFHIKKRPNQRSSSTEINIEPETVHNLTVQEKWNIIALMWKEYNPEKKSYPKNVLSIVANQVRKSTTTVAHVQEEYVEQLTTYPGSVPNLSPKYKGRSYSGLLSHQSKIEASFLASGGHWNYAEQSRLLQIPKTTLFTWMQKLGIQHATSYIKPTLNDAQKCKRILFILHQINDPVGVEDTLLKLPSESMNVKFRFKSFQNHIFVDEAWFFLKHLFTNVYRLPSISVERIKDDTTISKTHIPKVMFFMAIGLPSKSFDGKAGIWPMVQDVPAKRSSKNRPRGTVEKKAVSMVASEYELLLTGRKGLFEKLDSIGKRSSILNWVVQQDGAKPHVSKHVIGAIKEAGQRHGKRIIVYTQPPQSPDLNVLDLAFINSIQVAARQIQYQVESVEKFINHVQRAFDDYPVDKLVRICALQLVAYREILKCFGDNQYDMPHTNIRNRQNANLKANGDIFEDCADLYVEIEHVREAIEYFNSISGIPFSWKSHPDYCANISEVSEIKDTEGLDLLSQESYFNSDVDSDDYDDPYDDRDFTDDDI
jgi:hypothetical protein